MHNLKSIRENLDLFKKKTFNRNTNIDFSELLDLDKKNRELIQKKEKLEQEKKTISKNKDKTKFNKSKEISTEIENLLNLQQEVLLVNLKRCLI